MLNMAAQISRMKFKVKGGAKSDNFSLIWITNAKGSLGIKLATKSLEWCGFQISHKVPHLSEQRLLQTVANCSQEVMSRSMQFVIVRVNTEEADMEQSGRDIGKSCKPLGEGCWDILQPSFHSPNVLKCHEVASGISNGNGVTYLDDSISMT